MDIKKFAAEHRLKLTRDGEGEDIEYVIAGRVGQSQIYEHGEGLLGVAFITSGKLPPRTGLFNTFCAACREAGMTSHQVGDTEGSFLFDPADLRQAKAAIRGVRARAKRQMSPERVAALTATLAAARRARDFSLETTAGSVS